MSVLELENQIEFLENPRIASIENIPSLVYLNVAGNEEIKRRTSSILKNVVLNFTPITHFTKMDFSSNHPNEKKLRKFWNSPGSPEEIEVTSQTNLPLIDLSLHYFFFKSSFLNENILFESLKVLYSLYQKDAFCPTTRIMLDTLMYIPMFVNKSADQRRIGYQLLCKVSQRAEKECNVKVITCAQSIYVLFPENTQ